MSRLFYDKPAAGNWEAALPIGNGRLGAMIFGEEEMEHLQLNEESLWSGGRMDRINPDARQNLDRVRELIFAGRIPEAERLLKFAFTGTPQSQRAYQTLGDLYVDLMDTVTAPEDYERELDLAEAIHRVRVRDGRTGIFYERVCFATAVDHVIVLHLTSDRRGSVRAGAMLTRSCLCDISQHEGDMVFMEGCTGGDGIEFCAGITMCAENSGMAGGVHATGEHLVCEGADAITIYMTAVTSFRESACLREAVRGILKRASERGFERIREEHIRDYKTYFNTCSLGLSYNVRLDSLTTDQRLKRVREGEADNGLINTYFDFGRYLLISSSRPGTLPANLQGIWNRDVTPPWGSKYTININTEMNYWGAETLGLSLCHLPLFDLLKRVEESGRVTAEKMYGCRGFVAHHNTDIWGDTAPQDMYIPATYWVMGGAWLCTHIWQHYEFTGDMDFLREMYGTIRSAVEFFMDFLVEYQGEYVTCPSLSPENTYILPDGTRGCVCFGSTMDNEILHDLFAICEKAGRLCGEKEEFLGKVEYYRSRLPRLKIGSEGQLLEWMEEYGEAEPGHRHISHLYALYPSNQISVGRTPELIQAAEETLRRRLENGGGHTGWSRAWMIGMYARLWEGEKAYENLILLLQKSTLDNLFDYHPPFQIDGNFGSIAAIGEMLLQSHDGYVVLLPALPKKWPSGFVRGLRARGGASYEIVWEQGRLQIFSVTGLRDYEADVFFGERGFRVSVRAGERKSFPVMR